MLKVAGFAAQLEHYERAIKIYEEVCNLIRIVSRITIYDWKNFNPIITMLFKIPTYVPSISNHKNILPLLWLHFVTSLDAITLTFGKAFYETKVMWAKFTFLCQSKAKLKGQKHKLRTYIGVWKKCI